MSNTIRTGHANHLRLTVTDPKRSREFYTRLLGFEVLMEFPDGALVGNGSLVLGLRNGPDPDRSDQKDRFDPNCVGLDHLALTVAGHDELTAAARLLDEHEVAHGEIIDLGDGFGLYVMMLEDPDGIQLELAAPRS